MKELYFMRHGETLFNKQEKIQGWCDSPLTDEGIRQAKAAGELLKDIQFDHYYCSTAERCSDTLELAVGSDVPYVRMKALKERYFGTFEGEHEYLNPPVWGDGFGYDDLFPNYGGETRDEVTKRLRTAIDGIMEQDDTKTVLVVSHAGAGYSFLDDVADASEVQKMGGFKNCSIMHFTYDAGEYELVEILSI